jgi:two-component system chemotaxis sensor kinase CheA
MDVVRSNLQKMNGTISLLSKAGQGTTVLLKLPLTLAILPLLLVRVADEIYGVPLRSVIETVRVEPGQIHKVEGDEVLVVRAQTLPLLRLGKVFSVKQSQVVESANRAVILGVAQQKIALLVNELIGQESTVMKPLSSYLQDCRGLAGATVSGEGQVQLVLDPAGLLAATLPKPLAAGMPQ